MNLIKDVKLKLNDVKIDANILKDNNKLNISSTNISDMIKEGAFRTFRTKSYSIKIIQKDIIQDLYDKEEYYIVGYRIKNTSDEPITDVYQNGTKITIPPHKEVSLPTKWFTLLMSKMIYGFTASGVEVMVPNEVSSIDENFSNSFVDIDIPLRRIGVIDLLYKKLSIKDSTYNFLKKSNIVNLVTEEKICNAAKLLAFCMK